VNLTLTLGIDIGTTATKVLLLRKDGSWDLSSWPSQENVWENLRKWLYKRGQQVTRVGITSHTPSAAILGENGLIGRIIPWNEPLPKGCERPTGGEHVLSPNRAWVPSRLAQWESEFGPIGNGIPVQLKDVLNQQLTGVIARDSRSMRGYDGTGYYRLPREIIGTVTSEGQKLSGICEGAEVICGCDDLTSGVFGLSTEDGDIFNLANTSEHVGLVGVEAISGMSHLPALGTLPSLTYLSTSTGGASLATIFDESPSVESAKKFISILSNTEHQGYEQAWVALESINSDVLRIRDTLPKGAMKIGGGLAMIPQLVEARAATKMAGQEVSVLGVAKLAQGPLAVIFGAGKVGRGFLAQLLRRAGWRIHFVDPNPVLVSELENGSYSVVNLNTGEIDEINNYTVSSEEWRLKEADLVLTSLGASHLEEWASKLADFERNIDIILAENHPTPAALVRTHITSPNVGIAQAQVLRSCIEPTPEQVDTLGPLTVQVQDHWSLPLDGAALVRPELAASVSGFDLRPNFTTELTRKLFTYNAINAVVSYIGHQNGYEMLAEAANDTEIATIARAAGAEASSALVAAYGFTAGEQAEWVERALSKYQDHRIVDPIERQCRDPVRKLGVGDRLFGPILLCISLDIPCPNLLLGVKAALRYQPPKSLVVSDPSSAQLQGWIEEGGVQFALSQLGVELPSELIASLQE